MWAGHHRNQHETVFIFPVGMEPCTITHANEAEFSFTACLWVRLTSGYRHVSISNCTLQLQVLVELENLSGLQNESNICTYQLVVLQFVCKQLLHPASWTLYHRQCPRHYWCTTPLCPLVNCFLPSASVHHKYSLIQEWKGLQYEMIRDAKYTVYAGRNWTIIHNKYLLCMQFIGISMLHIN